MSKTQVVTLGRWSFKSQWQQVDESGHWVGLCLGEVRANTLVQIIAHSSVGGSTCKKSLDYCSVRHCKL